MKKISVIIPIYGVEKYLDRCLESVVNQTYKNLEIILIDDGSPDNCPQMCDEWARRDNRIKVIHKKNGGLMAAWIDGVKASSAELISFVDSDDWVELNYIEKLCEPFKNILDLDLSICNYYKVVEGEKFVEKSTNDGLSGLVELGNLEMLKEYKLNSFRMYRWNKMFKKSFILESLKYCDTRVSTLEDFCISAYCILKSKKVFIVDDCLYNYNCRVGSILNSYRPKLLDNFNYLLEMYKPLLKDLGYYTDKNAAETIVLILYLCVENIFNSNEKNKKSIYKVIYESNCYEDFLKQKIKVLKLKKRIFAKVLKSKNYTLMKMVVNLWHILKELKGLVY